MTPRRVLVLGLVAAAVIILAVLLANRRMETSVTSELLYPDLKTQADSIEAIHIFTAGDARAVEIVRRENEWTLPERGGYRADPAKVRTLVRALSNAKRLEEKTSDPTKYSALSVEDVSGEDAQGVRIELVGPAAPVNLIVGKDAPGAQSSYVRRVGEAKSWLISERIDAPSKPADWLDKQIIDISADRVQSARIAIAGQRPYTAVKHSRADANFGVEPLPKGKELHSPGAANGAATALMSLRLDDVKPQSELGNTQPDATATYTTFDGLVIELRGFAQDDWRYITLAASFDPELAERFKVKTANDAEGASSPKSATAPEADTTPDVAAQAESIAKKVADWAYRIPQYKYDAIFRSLDDLLKK